MDHPISNELPPVHNPEVSQQNMSPVETAGRAVDNESHAARAFEAASAGGAPSPAVVAPVAQPDPFAPVAQAPGAAAQQAAAGMPAIADDTDLIEKEWVLKAKEIVARTKQDPYQQNKEVERVKADYMKKRYNRDIKVTED